MKLRNTIKSIIIAMCTLFMVSTGYAQSGIWAFTYDIGFPMGETADYIGNTSWRGITIQGRSFVQPNLSVGGSFSWQVFHERVNETINFDYQPDEMDNAISGALNGEQLRYINTLPLMVNAHYYLGDALLGAKRPFVGISVGTAPTKKRTEVGIIAIDEYNWHFAIAPEIGFLFPMDSGIDLMTSVKYNVALKSNESINYSYIGIQVGIANIF